MPKLIQHAWKYVRVGACAWVVDMTTFKCLCHFLNLDPVMANLFSRPLGGVVSFTLNKLWTFKDNGQKNRAHVQFARYWLVWAACFTASSGLIALFYHGLGVSSPLGSKLCAEALVGIMSFLLSRHWTFK